MRRKWIFLVVIAFLLCSCGKNEPTVEPNKHIYDNNTLHEEKDHNSELSGEAKGSWSTEALNEIEKAKEGPEPGKYDKKYDNYGLWPIENIPEVWNAEVDEGDDPDTNTTHFEGLSYVRIKPDRVENGLLYYNILTYNEESKRGKFPYDFVSEEEYSADIDEDNVKIWAILTPASFGEVTYADFVEHIENNVDWSRWEAGFDTEGTIQHIIQCYLP